MKSIYFTEEHHAFRDNVRDFVTREVVPHAPKWEADRMIPKHFWKSLGDLGYLGINHPEVFGGSEADFFYSVVFLEEISRAGFGGLSAAVAVHEYMATAHLSRTGSDALRQKYLAPAIAGDMLGALAISEPNTGSDVARIETTAVLDGENLVVNGSKMFITNGTSADFITTAVRLRMPEKPPGIALVIIDGSSPGVSTSKLDKIGWHCSDTAEIGFDHVVVPVENIIGEANKGFSYIMESFQLERLVGAIMSIGGMDACLEQTINYMTSRRAFKTPLIRFQALRHRLADLMTELETVRHFTYHTCWLFDQGEVPVAECSMAKLKATELSNQVVDACLQFHGGYGYMEEYPVARMYRDSRVGTIVGGTSEIMREIIAKIQLDSVIYKAAYESESPAEAESIHEIMQKLPSQLRTERAAGVDLIVSFALSGDGGGNYTVTIKNGVCSVDSGLEEQAHCLVEADALTYADVATGKMPPEAAFMTGKVKVSDMPQMIKFTGLFSKGSS